MTDATTAADVARSLADVLEERGFPYAIGGALALGYYALPRATVDVDLNVFVAPDRGMATILEALSAAGFVADEESAAVAKRARSEGQFRGRLAGLRVDVFVPAIAYYAELAERRREVILLGRPAWILGPEDLVVLKMMFFRRKDLADVEAVMRVQGKALNREFIRRKLVDLIGPDDERIREFDHIDRDVGR
jgi:predicted nucleotidyltransferase